VMTYEQYFHHEEVCTRCTTPLQKPFVYLSSHFAVTHENRCLDQ
jgi:hypothetical protein